MLWALGYPDQALKRLNEAVGLAQDCPILLAWGLSSFLLSFYVIFEGR